jgi:hypothetical protein
MDVKNCILTVSAVAGIIACILILNIVTMPSFLKAAFSQNSTTLTHTNEKCGFSFDFDTSGEIHTWNRLLEDEEILICSSYSGWITSDVYHSFSVGLDQREESIDQFYQRIKSNVEGSTSQTSSAFIVSLKEGTTNFAGENNTRYFAYTIRIYGAFEGEDATKEYLDEQHIHMFVPHAGANYQVLAVMQGEEMPSDINNYLLQDPVISSFKFLDSIRVSNCLINSNCIDYCDCHFE